MPKEMNLQDAILNSVRQQGQNVTVFLTNGFQLRGSIRGFDSFTILLETDGKQQMIYKHAVSTIVPQKQIDFLNRCVRNALIE